jgi:hypothetical protein
VIVEFSGVPPDRVEADCLVLFLHADDRPPVGAAGLVDWRLNGALSRLLKDGWYGAAFGETLLLAFARRTRAQRVLAVGLGPRPESDAARLRAAGQRALSALARMGAVRVAITPPGPGAAEEPEAARVVAIVEGLLDAVRGPTPPETRPHVVLVVPFEGQTAVAAALQHLRDTTGAGYHFDLRPLPAARPVSQGLRTLSGAPLPGG